MRKPGVGHQYADEPESLFLHDWQSGCGRMTSRAGFSVDWHAEVAVPPPSQSEASYALIGP